MKKILFVILFLLPVAIIAQVKDQKATTLLNEVSAKMKSYKTIKADFSYNMENKQAKINETKTGVLLISGDKYRLSTTGQAVICDGQTVWTYIKESNEVQVNTLDTQDDAMTPSKLLTSYGTNYKASLLKEKENVDPNAEWIELIPNSSKNFTKAILIVDKVKKQVKGFKLFDKSGNIFTYKVTKFQSDIPASPSEFTFEESKYPGVEVIDMR